MRAVIVHRGGGPYDGEEEIDASSRIEFYRGKGRPIPMSEVLAGRGATVYATYKYVRTEQIDGVERRIYRYIGEKTPDEQSELVARLATDVEVGADGKPRFRDADDFSAVRMLVTAGLVSTSLPSSKSCLSE
jgi:hypothetical protein